MSEDCIFCKIAAGQIPARLVYEDDAVLAFHDINPQAPVHVLVIPRRHIPAVGEMTVEDRELVGHLFWAARRVAGELGIDQSGYRLVINNGRDAQQTVHHLHLHVLGGRALGWPPG